MLLWVNEKAGAQVGATLMENMLLRAQTGQMTDEIGDRGIARTLSPF